MTKGLSPTSKIIVGTSIFMTIIVLSVPFVSADVGTEGVQNISSSIDEGLRKARLASVELDDTVRFTINPDCSWSYNVAGTSTELHTTSSLIKGLDCKVHLGGHPVVRLDFKPEGYVFVKGQLINQPVHIQITSKIIRAAEHGETILPSGLAVMDEKAS